MALPFSKVARYEVDVHVNTCATIYHIVTKFGVGREFGGRLNLTKNFPYDYSTEIKIPMDFIEISLNCFRYENLGQKL